MADDTPSLRTAWPFLTALALTVLGVVLAIVLGGTDGRAAQVVTGYGLDVEDPWPLRGNAGVLREDTRATLPEPWRTATPLFAHEVDGDVELVLLDAARDRWAVATERPGGWTLLPQGLDLEVGLLVAALPQGRVLAVAAPAVEELSVGPAVDGPADFLVLDRLADGVGQQTGLAAEEASEVRGTVAGQQVVRSAPFTVAPD